MLGYWTPHIMVTAAMDNDERGQGVYCTYTFPYAVIDRWEDIVAIAQFQVGVMQEELEGMGAPVSRMRWQGAHEWVEVSEDD